MPAEVEKPKSVGFILPGATDPAPYFLGMHPTVVEMPQSNARRWTNTAPVPAAGPLARL